MLVSPQMERSGLMEPNTFFVLFLRLFSMDSRENKYRKWLEALDDIYKLTRSNKLDRLVHYPFRLPFSWIFRKLIAPFYRSGKLTRVKTFWNAPIYLLLPASLDIYVFGAKNHTSEIRLAKFMIQQLKEGCTFWDIGAHVGYFSLLASILTGKNGKVVAFEATPRTYDILVKNLADKKNTTTHHYAVSDTDETVELIEYPVGDSENNTIVATGSTGFKRGKSIQVPGIRLDTYAEKDHDKPDFIKIDVEGAELRVLQGMEQLLSHHKPVILMECWNINAPNSMHDAAVKFLARKGYDSYIIERYGELEIIQDVPGFFQKHPKISENLVFMKP